MDDAVSDLVLDWRLDSTIVSDSCTQETKYVSNPMTGLWRTRVQETWKRTELLGNGSFGYVWLEQCIAGPRAGKARAVKEIRTRCGSTAYDPLFLSRELLAIMKFSHQRYRDCFVRSFGWYDTPDAIYITMEYLPLGDLQSYISRRRLKEAEAKRITLQILQGIAFMHQSGFAHRDIKPSNILIQHTGPNWWVKIADFGTSKQIEATALRTQTGTQAYLAPEVLGIFPPGDRKISSAPTYSLAVDIWAIGIVAYRIAVGRLPFPEPANLTGYVFYGDPFPVDALLSPECTSFINSVLSTSPRLRPTAAQALESGWINASSPGPASRSPPPRNTIALPLISRDHGGPASSDPELVTQIRASPLPPQDSSGFSAPDIVPVKKFEEMNVSDEEASGRWTTMYNDPATPNTHEHGTAAETSIDSKNDGISDMISDSSNKDGDLVAGRFDFVAKDTNSDGIPVANDTFDDDVDINTDSQGEKVDKTWGNSVWHYDENNRHDRATSSDKNDQWWVDAASEDATIATDPPGTPSVMVAPSSIQS
ncbi:kinase-like domain-containing protein [Ilyonectria robusta]|uniref:kinase-like domain-containing protein n=1 Tax=Ilyonectria robusta TaxID=1079257 RepID=UPI001E8D548F|nr:kinase-like domain-containing protein [Ilyonectria robusta]KAH8646451.1 kinase-like domain-containing protein [Ilyonectria robusta]